MVCMSNSGMTMYVDLCTQHVLSPCYCLVHAVSCCVVYVNVKYMCCDCVVFVRVIDIKEIYDTFMKQKTCEQLC